MGHGGPLKVVLEMSFTPFPTLKNGHLFYNLLCDAMSKIVLIDVLDMIFKLIF